MLDGGRAEEAETRNVALDLSRGFEPQHARVAGEPRQEIERRLPVRQ
jgi:hypothetical protein